MRAQKARGELTPPPYTTILGRVAGTSIKAFIVPARFELSRQTLRSGSYNGSNRVRHSTILVNLCERIGFPETTIPAWKGRLFCFFNLEGEQTNWEYEFTKLQNWYTGFNFIFERRIFRKKCSIVENFVFSSLILSLIFFFFFFFYSFVFLKEAAYFWKWYREKLMKKWWRENFEDMEKVHEIYLDLSYTEYFEFLLKYFF